MPDNQTHYLHLDDRMFELAEGKDAYEKLNDAMKAQPPAVVEFEIIVRSAEGKAHPSVRLRVNCAEVTWAFVANFPDRPISYV